MHFVEDHVNLPVFYGAACLVMEKDVVDLTVDGWTDSDNVECIIESYADFKDSVDEDSARLPGPLVPMPMDYCKYICMHVQQ